MNDALALLETQDPPVLIVTARGAAGRAGCVVGFSTQCSIYPPRLLVCISILNHTEVAAEQSEALGVHVLGRRQLAMAEIFGGRTGDDVDKFAGLSVSDSLRGTPILNACVAWMEGAVIDRFDLGDHIGYLLDVIDGGTGSETGVLRVSEIEWLRAGHPAEEVIEGGGVNPRVPAKQESM